MKNEDFAYAVRRMGPHVFEVAKFSTRDAPDAVYEVTINRNNAAHCSCPGWRWTGGEGHKHVKLVRLFLTEQEPLMAVYKLDGGDNPYRTF